jgi:hypothetical protein
MKRTDEQLPKNSPAQSFDRGASVRLCDIQNSASLGKILGNAKRDWESAVEKKRGKN